MGFVGLGADPIRAPGGDYLRPAMLRRAFALIPLTALLVGGVLVAGASTAGAVPPEKWTTSVCGALDTWRQDIDAAAAAAAESPATDAKSAKKSLGTLMSSIDDATVDLGAALKQAGSPDGSGGKKIASTLRSSFKQVDRAIAEAKRTIAKTKTADQGAFVTSVRAGQDGAEAGLESAQAALGAARYLDTPELLQAFAADPACASVVAPDPDAPGVVLSPSEGPPGTEIAVAPDVDPTGVDTCLGSSAFRTELLGADGAILATGSEAIAVPANATPGVDVVRLVCYLPEGTGRRVIHGLCAPFVVTGGEAVTPSAGCPPAPRVLVGQAILEAEGGLSNGANAILAPLGG
jgi:hypothetical protein